MSFLLDIFLYNNLFSDLLICYPFLWFPAVPFLRFFSGSLSLLNSVKNGNAFLASNSMTIKSYHRPFVLIISLRSGQ